MLGRRPSIIQRLPRGCAIRDDAFAVSAPLRAAAEFAVRCQAF
jgi:hypothetical protein